MFKFLRNLGGLLHSTAPFHVPTGRPTSRTRQVLSVLLFLHLVEQDSQLGLFTWGQGRLGSLYQDCLLEGVECTGS